VDSARKCRLVFSRIHLFESPQVSRQVGNVSGHEEDVNEITIVTQGSTASECNFFTKEKGKRHASLSK